MAGLDVPDFDLSTLTIDQHGMLEILGKPRILAYRTLQFRLEPTKYEGVVSIARAREVEHACPVVTILGRDRVILPNGDMLSYADLDH